MNRRLAPIGVLLLTLLLAGCEDTEPVKPDPIEQGIRCKNAGGSWTWDNWTGYHCEFKQPQEK